MSNHADELVELEERFWIEGGGSPEFWQTHFADDGVVALPFGIMDKHETVQAMHGAPPWTRVDMADLRVLALGDSSALVAYRHGASLSRPGRLRSRRRKRLPQTRGGMAAGVPSAE
ncbi:MAG: hypothetical protein R6U94_06460, partial [Nitriliruptoraceae bacterium]